MTNLPILYKFYKWIRETWHATTNSLTWLNTESPEVILTCFISLLHTGLLDTLCSAMPPSSRISISFAAVSWRALPAQWAASAARIDPCESLKTDSFVMRRFQMNIHTQSEHNHFQSFAWIRVGSEMQMRSLECVLGIANKNSREYTN